MKGRPLSRFRLQLHHHAGALPPGREVGPAPNLGPVAAVGPVLLRHDGHPLLQHLPRELQQEVGHDRPQEETFRGGDSEVLHLRYEVLQTLRLERARADPRERTLRVSVQDMRQDFYEALRCQEAPRAGAQRGIFFD